MRFAKKGEEHRYLAGNEFIKKMQNAPEWMVSKHHIYNYLVLRIRDKPTDPWQEYYSPDPINMSTEEWLGFIQEMKLVSDLRKMDRIL